MNDRSNVTPPTGGGGIVPTHDRFKSAAQWMELMEKRVDSLIDEVARLQGVVKYQGERIKELEDFRRGVQLVMKPAREEMGNEQAI